MHEGESMKWSRLAMLVAVMTLPLTSVGQNQSKRLNRSLRKKTSPRAGVAP